MKSNRRDAIQRIAGLGAIGSLALGGGALLHGRVRKAPAEEAQLKRFDVERSAAYATMAISRGGTAVSNTRAVLEALGGMQTFVSAGDRVVIKPNVAWKRVPEQAATTNPEVIAELVRQCLDSGAKSPRLQITY